MAYLIDADILINSIKGNSRIHQRIAELAVIPKAISIITYGELIYGAKKSKQVEKNSSIIYRIAEIFPIIGISRAIMETFVELKVSLERKGQRLDEFDLMIAATALSLNYTLVTNNSTHFRRIEGIRLENWME
jgi:tRNA(fMet)-specific endonuclease VapC